MAGATTARQWPHAFEDDYENSVEPLTIKPRIRGYIQRLTLSFRHGGDLTKYRRVGAGTPVMLAHDNSYAHVIDEWTEYLGGSANPRCVLLREHYLPMQALSLSTLIDLIQDLLLTNVPPDLNEAVSACIEECQGPE